MIVSFGNQLASDLYDNKVSKETRRFPKELLRIARRKLLFLHEADLLRDLKSPPGNKLEALKGNLNGYHAIRINKQWRLVFRFENSNALDVKIIDYHS